MRMIVDDKRPINRLSVGKVLRERVFATIFSMLKKEETIVNRCCTIRNEVSGSSSPYFERLL